VLWPGCVSRLQPQASVVRWGLTHYRAQVAVVRAFNSMRDPLSGSDKGPWLGAAVDLCVSNLKVAKARICANRKAADNRFVN
jgi:hypothetical protein